MTGSNEKETRPAMQFMFCYPEAYGPSVDMLAPGRPAELAHAAEESGWNGFAFTEHPAPGARWLEAGGHQSLDPFVALATVATATSRMRLLTYLAVLAYRNPLLLAKTVATLDIMSDGRAILGAGAGYLRGEFRALGVDFEERNLLFDEALEVLPKHWSGEPFDYQGRHFVAKNTVALPRPVQQPIPIWVGGNSKTARRRVAQHAQGWLPVLGTGEMFTTIRTSELASVSELAAAVTQLRADAGPRGASIDVGIGYPDHAIADQNADIGHHRAAFAELAEAGVTWLMFAGPSGATREETAAFLERLGRDYFS
jgi:probable F420-dependent oxidoreductase